MVITLGPTAEEPEAPKDLLQVDKEKVIIGQFSLVYKAMRELLDQKTNETQTT